MNFSSSLVLLEYVTLRLSHISSTLDSCSGCLHWQSWYRLLQVFSPQKQQHTFLSWYVGPTWVGFTLDTGKENRRRTWKAIPVMNLLSLRSSPNFWGSTALSLLYYFFVISFNFLHFEPYFGFECRPLIDPIAMIFDWMLCGKRLDSSQTTADYSLVVPPMPNPDSIEAARRR